MEWIDIDSKGINLFNLLNKHILSQDNIDFVSQFSQNKPSV